MTTEEKIAFLLETIPSKKEVDELKRRYLFGGLEYDLLLEASRTLHTPAPNPDLVAWAYDLLNLYARRQEERRSTEEPTMQEKSERIIALFSNPEELQTVVERMEWSPSDKRAIRLVAHFVANDIPLASNLKLVDKVYRLLENSYLPAPIAVKYFGRKDTAREELEAILESYRDYRAKKARHQTGETPLPPASPPFWKRYAYFMGSVAAVAAIFAAGFFTGKMLYDRPEGSLTPSAFETLVKKTEKSQEANETAAANSAVTPQAVQKHFAPGRQALQKGLDTYGLGEKADFLSQAVEQAQKLAAAGADALPSEIVPTCETKAREAKGSPHLAASLAPIARLAGLTPLDPAKAMELAARLELPEGFRLATLESPSSRLLYLERNETLYPLELYHFGVEPLIVQYTLLGYKTGRYMPAVSNVWHFSPQGELLMHRHYVYQKGRISPKKIVTNHFLPDGATVETVSVPKMGRNHTAMELPLARTDYLPSGMIHYKERFEISRLAGEWRAETASRAWYEEGRKVRAAKFGTPK
ncbi:hypothetical protein [Hydrogenimonas sp.]